MTTSRKAAAGLLFVLFAAAATPYHAHASASLTISSATLASDGKTLTVAIGGVSGSLSPSTGVNSFIPQQDGVNLATTSEIVSGTSVVITLTATIVSGQAITVNAVTGNLVDSSSNTMAPSTGTSVTNNSTVASSFYNIADDLSDFNYNGMPVLANWNGQDALDRDLSPAFINSYIYNYPLEFVIDGTQLESTGYMGYGDTVSVDGGAPVSYSGPDTNGTLILATGLAPGKHLIRMSFGFRNGIRVSGGANTITTTQQALGFYASDLPGLLADTTSPLTVWGTVNTPGVACGFAGYCSGSYGGTFMEFAFTGTDIDLSAIGGINYDVTIDGVHQAQPLPGGDSGDNNTLDYIRLNPTSLRPGYHTVKVEWLGGTTTNSFLGARVLNGTRLSTAVAASSTSITVDDASHYSVGDWLRIDYYSNQEFREITGISGNTLTVAALSYAHPQYTSVSSFTDSPGSISKWDPEFPSGKRVVGIGDSNTHSISPWGVLGIPDLNGTYHNYYDPRDSYLNTLSQNFGYESVNLGIQGTDSTNQLSRANDINTFSRGSFDYLTLLEGTNDINGDSNSPAQFKANVVGQIDVATSSLNAGGKVILMPLVTDECQTSGSGLSTSTVDADLISIASDPAYSPFTVYAKGMLNGFDYDSVWDPNTNPNGDMYGGTCSLHFGPGGAQLFANNLVPLMSTTGYTVTGPSSGVSGSASSNFIITRAGGSTWSAGDSVTITDGGHGGLFTPSVGTASTSSITITPTASTTSFTFTYTPASADDPDLTFTNGQNWADASPVVYAVSAAPQSSPSTATATGVGTISGWGSIGIPPGGTVTPRNTVACQPGNLFNTQTGAACPASNSALSSSSPTTTQTSAPSTWGFTTDLQIKSASPQAKLLQEYLNQHGYTVAATGAGSAGNETDYFGALTKAALIKFQKTSGITPAIGYFGPITRAFIAAHQ